MTLRHLLLIYFYSSIKPCKPDKETIAAVSAFKIFLPKFILLTSIDSKSCLSFNDQPPTGPIKIATLSFFDKEIFDIFFPFLSSSQKKNFSFCIPIF